LNVKFKKIQTVVVFSDVKIITISETDCELIILNLTFIKITNTFLRKMPELWSRVWRSYQGNTPVHEWFSDVLPTVEHAPYSLDLGLSEFFLSPE
jgi:hypothetical protein